MNFAPEQPIAEFGCCPCRQPGDMPGLLKQACCVQQEKKRSSVSHARDDTFHKSGSVSEDSVISTSLSVHFGLPQHLSSTWLP